MIAFEPYAHEPREVAVADQPGQPIRVVFETEFSSPL
jgi:hypothetical protein